MDRMLPLPLTAPLIDEEAQAGRLRRLWQAWYPRVHIYVAANLGGGCPELEDLAREVMIKILRGLHRRQAIRPEPLHAEPAGGESPEAILIRAETGGLVARYLETLAPRDREIAFLRFSEGLRYGEIARLIADSFRARRRGVRVPQAPPLELPSRTPARRAPARPLGSLLAALGTAAFFSASIGFLVLQAGRPPRLAREEIQPALEQLELHLRIPEGLLRAHVFLRRYL